MSPLKNILVTGGAGFIGSNFIDFYMNERDAQIINLDKLSYASRAQSLTHWDNHPRYQFIKGDIGDHQLVCSLLEKFHIDTIVNFAAESHVDRSIEAPIYFMENNALATAQLLESARFVWSKRGSRWHEMCRFHHISTDEVYGDIALDAEPLTEQAAYRPSSPYAASKASADLFCLAAHRTHQMPITISHCSNNYGPRQHAEKLLPTIIHHLRQNTPVPLYGDGLQRRDWLYVDDHCRAIDAILQKGVLGERYNITAQCELNNRDMVHAVYSAMKPHVRLAPWDEAIRSVADRKGHDRRYATSAEKLAGICDWQAQVSLQQGLNICLAYYLDPTLPATQSNLSTIS